MGELPSKTNVSVSKRLLSCKQVLCVHLYLTVIQFSVAMFYFEFLKILFINFVMRLVFTRYDTEHTLYKLIKKCHSLLHLIML